MASNARKIIALLSATLIFQAAGTAGAQSYLSGSAELSYNNFKAEANGENVFSGNTLAQQYSVDWKSTNIVYKNQPRYYTIGLGYDWTSFATEIDDRGAKSEINQVFGKFRYSGEVGFNSPTAPVKFRAYADNGRNGRLERNITSELMDDGLAYRLSNLSKGSVAGFSFSFLSDEAASSALRQLPRFYLDYREVVNKPVMNDGSSDDKTTELSVAGLNKENNWLQYSSIKYESFSNPMASYLQQKIQIGLVDQVGRRKWAALTNWIDVSADGSYMNKNGINDGSYEEEYDLNFLAFARRRNWEGRTVMNYNRELIGDRIEEKTRIPVYLKGVWSSDVDWYASTGFNRARELKNNGSILTSYSNSVTVGATMNKRSSFTFSPLLRAETSQLKGGGDGYLFEVGADTQSTRYYSDKANIIAGYRLKLKDDGMGAATSSTWSNELRLSVDYRPFARLRLGLKEQVEHGRGFGFVEQSRLGSSLLSRNNLQQYTRVISSASVGFIASSSFSTSLEATHDLVMAEDGQDESIQIGYNLSYNKNDMGARFNSRYQRNYSGTTFYNTGDAYYRPNRYHEAYLKLKLDMSSGNNYDTTDFYLIQGYNYNLFTRSGASRPLASLLEESSFARKSYNFDSYDTYTLQLTGRYFPTDRIALLGMGKYQYERGVTTLFYSLGAAMDFRLLTTSLDYSLAKRDSDNRTERRLSASVKRTF